MAMSEEQKEFFDTNGYIILPGVLDEKTVESLITAVDRLFADAVRKQRLTKVGSFELRNCIAYDDAFIPLLDWRTAVPLVPHILGWNIQLDTSHVIVRPPQSPEVDDSFKAIGWHRDGGLTLIQMPDPLPRLRLKICYVLSDLSQPGRGNTRFVPGSQRLPGVTLNPAKQPGSIDPEGAIEVLAEPGDAVLFENRLFHAVGPNRSPVTRKTIFMGYSYRWLRPMDYVIQNADLLAKVQHDPILWQLLGGWDTPLAFITTKDEDVPLRAWCMENGVDLGKPLSPNYPAGFLKHNAA